MNRLIRPIIRIRIKRKLIYLLMLLAVCTGCKGPKVVSEDAAQSGDTQLTLVLRDFYGGSEQEELRVIRNRKELAGIFAKINMTRKPGLPVPEIDFDTDVVLLYSPGKQQDTVVPELYYAGNKAGKYTVGVKPPNRQTAIRPDAPVVAPFLLYTLPAGDAEIGMEGRPGVLKPD